MTIGRTKTNRDSKHIMQVYVLLPYLGNNAHRFLYLMFPGTDRDVRLCFVLTHNRHMILYLLHMYTLWHSKNRSSRLKHWIYFDWFIYSCLIILGWLPLRVIFWDIASGKLLIQESANDFVGACRCWQDNTSASCNRLAVYAPHAFCHSHSCFVILVDQQWYVQGYVLPETAITGDPEHIEPINPYPPVPSFLEIGSAIWYVLCFFCRLVFASLFWWSRCNATHLKARPKGGGEQSQPQLLQTLRNLHASEIHCIGGFCLKMCSTLVHVVKCHYDDLPPCNICLLSHL